MVLSGAFGVVVGFVVVFVVGVGLLCQIFSPLPFCHRCLSFFLSLLLYPSPHAVLPAGFVFSFFLFSSLQDDAVTFVVDIVTVHKYLSPDGSLFYARVTSGQSGT